MQIQVQEGRSYSADRINEEDKIIFNQAAIDMMGLKEPLGTIVNIWGEQKQIIGVVENFHFESFYENIRPAVLLLRPHKTMNMLVRIEAGKEQAALVALQNFYKDFNPGYSFNYKRIK